ncbi:MAG: hypothetical protein C0490_01725 [Marivirga sp.]|nr:hypothetical protein [Marivirga sp.]
MNTQSLLQAGLLLHIIGLTSIAGVTLVGYIMSRQFRKLYAQDKQKGFAIIEATSKLPMVATIGLLLLVLSGVTMLAATGGAYGEQLWFKIKMIFVILIIAGSIFLRRVLEKRLRLWVLDDMIHANRTQQIGNLGSRIAYVQLFLLSFFIIIFILSSFRFN